MFGKLLKHEFRATGRIMLPVMAALLVLAVLSNLSIRALVDSDSTALVSIGTIILVLFFLGCVAVAIMSVVIMISRFRSSMLTDEGYLYHTLPVSVHQLIWSKLLIAIVYFAFVGLTLVASGSIAVFDVQLLRDVGKFLSKIFQELTAEIALHGAVYCLELLAAAFVSGLSICLMFYAAMSIGHSFANRKVLLSVVFYFVLYIAVQLISNLGISLLEQLVDWETISSVTTGAQIAWGFHAAMLFGIVTQAVFGAIFYLITAKMLKKHLNLA